MDNRHELAADRLPRYHLLYGKTVSRYGAARKPTTNSGKNTNGEKASPTRSGDATSMTRIAAEFRTAAQPNA